MEADEMRKKRTLIWDFMRFLRILMDFLGFLLKEIWDLLSCKHTKQLWNIAIFTGKAHYFYGHLTRG